jgi:hypothetical protein
MKKIMIIATIIFISIKGYSQTSDPILNDLLNIDKSLFINKPLDSLISVIPTGYIEIKVVGIRKTARNLRIMYPNRVWIDLHVRQFSHMNPVDPNRIWSIAQMRLENLHSVTVYKGINCYEGCPTY